MEIKLGQVKCLACNGDMLVNMDIWATFQNPMPFCEACHTSDSRTLLLHIHALKYHLGELQRRNMELEGRTHG